jgi:hypothetical protein
MCFQGIGCQDLFRQAWGEGRGDGRLRKLPPSGSNQNFTPRTGGGTNEVGCRKPFLGSSDSLNC